jgi:hypothetical protein
MATRQITRPTEGQGFNTRRDDQDCNEETQTAGRAAEPMLSAKSLAMDVKHQEFLNRVSTGDDPPITPETASLAAKAWHIIWLASEGKMPVPAACTGPDGEMFYSWDCGQHHLELEIIPGQPSEFFYRDRNTEQFWGDDYAIGDPLAAEVLQKLPLFR